MDLTISLNLPSGYSLSSGTQDGVPSNASPSFDATSVGATANAKSPGPIDVISISDNAYVAGNFTAIAGDTLRMGDLFAASTPTARTVPGFRVSLGDAGSNGGTLRLDGHDVAEGTTSFTVEQFARLIYIAGARGSQNIVVIARTGTRPPSFPDGTLSGLSSEIDSPAVQITVHVTSSRSINVMSALTTPPGTDAGIASIVQHVGVFTGRIGPLSGTTTHSAEQLERMTDTTGANDTQNIVMFAPSGTRQPSLPDGTLGVVYAVLCFVAICILVVVLQ